MSFINDTINNIKKGDPMTLFGVVLIVISLILWIVFATTKAPSENKMAENQKEVNAVKAKKTNLMIGGIITLIFGCAAIGLVHTNPFNKF